MDTMKYQYEYPRPSVTVDCVVFGLDDNEIKTLLIQRKLEPFKGEWALPGGFVLMDEDIDAAALRELREETSLDKVYLEQLYTYGAVERDPRYRVISVAYYALVKLSNHKVKAATDAENVGWFSASDMPKLAFDHNIIYEAALDRLRVKVRYEPIGFELLPKKFTLSELQKLYEIILEKTIDKRNFRKKILSMGIVLETDEIQQDVAHRAARLYQFDEKKYLNLKKQGFNFEI
jgi:8-oxo-dGTP diphosphatase